MSLEAAIASLAAGATFLHFPPRSAQQPQQPTNLSEAEFGALFGAMRSAPSLRDVSLHNLNLHEGRLPGLVEALLGCTALCRLRLECCVHTEAARGALSLALRDIVVGHGTLVTLALPRNQLRFAHLNPGLASIRADTHPAFADLDLSSNVLYGTRAETIAELVRLTPLVTGLRLGNAQLHETSVTAIATAAAGSARLRVLYVGANGVSSRTYAAITALVLTLAPNLEALVVPVEREPAYDEDLDATNAALAALATAVSNNVRITRFGFRGNYLPQDAHYYSLNFNGPSIPMGIIAAHLSKEGCTLRELAFHQVELSGEEVQALLNGLEACRSLRCLSLNAVGLRREELRRLTGLLAGSPNTTPPSIETLTLRGDAGIEGRPMAAVLRALERRQLRYNHTLRRFVGLPSSDTLLTELRRHYRVPHVRFTARMRVMCQAGRARSAAGGVGAALAWLCEVAPLWVVVHVCALLREED